MMDLPELARETHLAELSRKEELTGALAFPVGLLTALAAALGSMVTAISLPLDYVEISLLALAGVAALVAVYAAFFLVRARMAHVYFYPAKISAIKSWRDSVVSSGRSEPEADDLLREYLLDEYVKCASRNSDNNDARSAQIFRANQALVVLLMLSALAGLPFLAVKIGEVPLPTKAGVLTSNMSHHMGGDHVGQPT